MKCENVARLHTLSFLLLLFSSYSNASSLIFAEGVKNFTPIYDDAEATVEKKGRNGKLYPNQGAQLVSINGKTFGINVDGSVNKGFVLKSATRCLDISLTSTDSIQNPSCPPSDKVVPPSTDIAQSAKRLTQKIDTLGTDIHTIAQKMEGGAANRLAITSAGIISVGVFLAGLIVEYIRRSAEKSDAINALLAEVSANANTAQEYLSRIVLQENGSPNSSIAIKGLVFDYKFASSSNIYNKIKFEHLRKNRLMNELAQLYINANVIANYQQDTLKNKDPHIEQTNCCLLLVEICSLLLQFRYVTTLLSGRFFSKRGSKNYVRPVNFLTIKDSYKQVKIALYTPPKPWWRAVYLYAAERIEWLGQKAAGDEDNQRYILKKPDNFHLMMDSLKDSGHAEFILNIFMTLNGKLSSLNKKINDDNGSK